MVSQRRAILAAFGPEALPAQRVLPDGLTWTEGAEGHFLTWLRDGAPEPVQMNCWEMVLFLMESCGIVTRAQILGAGYQQAADQHAAGAGQTEDAARSAQDAAAALLELDRAEPLSGDAPPQLGDTIFFFDMDHVAISLGGDRVISLWNFPSSRPEITTITALMGHIGYKRHIREMLGKLDFKRREWQDQPRYGAEYAAAGRLRAEAIRVDDESDADAFPALLRAVEEFDLDYGTQIAVAVQVKRL